MRTMKHQILDIFILKSYTLLFILPYYEFTVNKNSRQRIPITDRGQLQTYAFTGVENITNICSEGERPMFTSLNIE